MARPLEFDRQLALSQALGLFWERGYTNTSIHDLLNTLGIKRGSLYAAFGDKRSLFFEVLDLYEQQIWENLKLHGCLDFSCPNPVERIHRFFNAAVVELAAEQKTNGCLFVNVVVEVANIDNNLRDSVQTRLLKIEQVFCNLLQQAISLGQISASKDPGVLASYVMNTIYGMRIRGKGDPYRLGGDNVVRTALSVLN